MKPPPEPPSPFLSSTLEPTQKPVAPAPQRSVRRLCWEGCCDGCYLGLKIGLWCDPVLMILLLSYWANTQPNAPVNVLALPFAVLLSMPVGAVVGGLLGAFIFGSVPLVAWLWRKLGGAE